MSFRGPEGNSRREPITTAIRMQGAYLMEDSASGVWGFTPSRQDAEGAFTEDAVSGVLGVDDTTTTHEAGLTAILRAPDSALVYTVT